MNGTIRLGCLYCDTHDHDGVDSLPTDCEILGEVGSYEEATRPVHPDDRTRSVFDWQTHLGICPVCLRTDGNAISVGVSL